MHTLTHIAPDPQNPQAEVADALYTFEDAAVTRMLEGDIRTVEHVSAEARNDFYNAWWALTGEARFDPAR
jgi:hypothetical protein